jgi:hypothetical protein
MVAIPIIPYCICRGKAMLVLGICIILLLVTQEGHAMQPPPPPLDIAQLKTLIAEANLIVVGRIDEAKETENTVEAAIHIEELLKGKVAGKTIGIKETYKTANSQTPGLESKDAGESNKIITRSTAGPSTYHGRYNKGARIVVLMEKIEGTDKYKPLGSGTYNKHLCEFLIENDSIKTNYFKFAEDVEKYIVSEKQFVGFIKELLRSNSTKGKNYN